MNKLVRVPRNSSRQKSEPLAQLPSNRLSNRRRGLCTAEELVNLILRKYGIEEINESDHQVEGAQAESTQTSLCQAESSAAQPASSGQLISDVETIVIPSPNPTAAAMSPSMPTAIPAAIPAAGPAAVSSPTAAALVGAPAQTQQMTFCWD